MAKLCFPFHETLVHDHLVLREKLARGLLVLHVYIEDNSARLRKFATLAKFQNAGLGTKLITHILNALKDRGIEYFWCDARITAIGFYQKFNMMQEGGEFNKSGVLYVKMKVELL